MPATAEMLAAQALRGAGAMAGSERRAGRATRGGHQPGRHHGGRLGGTGRSGGFDKLVAAARRGRGAARSAELAAPAGVANDAPHRIESLKE